MIKLVDTPGDGGADVAEVAANPSVLLDLREDILVGLMQTSHALERPLIAEAVDKRHPRRRVCI